MCLSTVYLVKEGTREKLCEYVSNVKASGGEVEFTDVMGQIVKATGTITSMDFIKNEILIEA